MEEALGWSASIQKCASVACFLRWEEGYDTRQLIPNVTERMLLPNRRCIGISLVCVRLLLDDTTLKSGKWRDRFLNVIVILQ